MELNIQPPRCACRGVAVRAHTGSALPVSAPPGTLWNHPKPFGRAL